MFAHLVPLCKHNYEIIKEVFNNPEQVMAKFVLNLYQLKLSDYVHSRLSLKAGSYEYLQVLYELHSRYEKKSNHEFSYAITVNTFNLEQTSFPLN